MYAMVTKEPHTATDGSTWINPPQKWVKYRKCLPPIIILFHEDPPIAKQPTIVGTCT